MPVSKKKVIQELKKIKVADQKIVDQFKIVKVSRSQLKNFIEFIRSTSVLGLAVGIVIGGAVGVMVRSLIENVIMPPFGLLLGSPDGIKGLTWTIGRTSAGKDVILRYGLFLNDLANFIIIAFVVYLIINLLQVGKDSDKKK